MNSAILMSCVAKEKSVSLVEFFACGVTLVDTDCRRCLMRQFRDISKSMNLQKKLIFKTFYDNPYGQIEGPVITGWLLLFLQVSPSPLMTASFGHLHFRSFSLDIAFLFIILTPSIVLSE